MGSCGEDVSCGRDGRARVGDQTSEPHLQDVGLVVVHPQRERVELDAVPPVHPALHDHHREPHPAVLRLEPPLVAEVGEVVPEVQEEVPRRVHVFLREPLEPRAPAGDRVREEPAEAVRRGGVDVGRGARAPAVGAPGAGAAAADRQEREDEAVVPVADRVGEPAAEVAGGVVRVVDQRVVEHVAEVERDRGVVEEERVWRAAAAAAVEGEVAVVAGAAEVDGREVAAEVEEVTRPFRRSRGRGRVAGGPPRRSRFALAGGDLRVSRPPVVGFPTTATGTDPTSGGSGGLTPCPLSSLCLRGRSG